MRGWGLGTTLATNRLLIAALEEYEDSGTTQIKGDVKKTPAKMLLST